MFFEMAGVAELICLEDAIVMGVNPLRERITMEVKNSVQVRILPPPHHVTGMWQRKPQG